MASGLMGHNEVLRLRRDLQQIISRAQQVDIDDYDLRSDLAMLVCVRISGFVERAYSELAMDYIRRHAQGPVKEHGLSWLDRLPNPTYENLYSSLCRFSLSWGDAFEAFCDQRRRDAINSIVGLRNDIAHGRVNRPSLGRVLGYLQPTDEVVDELVRIFS